MSDSQSSPIKEPSGFIEKIALQLRLTHGMEIARRYLAMNAFDGVLPVLGILMGGLIAMTHQNPIFVYETSFLAIVGSSFAMLVSGITSSYLTEGAERKRDILELEKSLLRDLEGTAISEASKTTTIIVSLINGLSPSLTALLTIIPMLLPVFNIVSIELSFVFSIIVGMVVLFLLGSFLGKISKTNIVLYGVKTLAAGFIVVIMMWLFSLIS
jgi:predicted membrane protein (TIGR00267 family)